MLKPPAWAKGAVPTEKGWVNPKNGELLVSRKHSDRQLIEYWNFHKGSAPAPTPAPIQEPAPIIEADPVIEEAAPTAEPLIEADPVDYWSMTKSVLAEHAYEVYGIDLDTSMTKAQMIEELEAQI
jgi:hypothetical protein